MRKWGGGRFLACGVVFYVLVVALVSVIGWGYAVGKADALLESAVEDFNETTDDSLNYILSFVAYALEEELATAGPIPRERLENYLRIYNVDEICIAGSNGQWIAATEDIPLNASLTRNRETAQYLDILKAGVMRVYQPFRNSTWNPEIRRKYVGLPFKDGSGIIQIGLNESRFIADFSIILWGFLDHWNVGDQRFYLLADCETGEIYACGDRRCEAHVVGRGLADVGFPLDGSSVTSVRQTGCVTLGGRSCRYRAEKFYGCILVALIPDSEFYSVRFLVVALPTAILGVVLVFVFIMFRVQRKSRYAELRLHAERIRQQKREQRRQTADLSLARNIQRSALPSVFPPYPRDLTIDLYADMTPARDVGGDFYDFFYAAPGRLAVLVADVSGKGVPAAMFMMKAKSIVRELVLSMSDFGEAVARANERLCEGNEADMFVTCWIGILDKATGVLRYVNAGHNPPYVLGADGSIRTLPEVSGLFLGGMEGVRYREYATTLRPRDLLFLYTDGVTEAINVLEQPFGEARLEDVLCGRLGMGLARFGGRRAALQSTRSYCDRVKKSVDAFAGKAAQYDDITTLALRYRGDPRSGRLELPASLESVPKFSAFVEEWLVGADCPGPVKSDILVALDEVTNNVAQYSGSERMTVEVEIAADPSVARVTVSDSGRTWNPLEHLDPDITLSADEREIGGLGILMVKRLMDDVSYATVGGRNVLRFRKAFGDDV